LSAIYNDFVTWLRRGPFAVALLIALSSAGYQSSGFAQNDSQRDVSKLLPEEEKDSYDIWSTVLRIKEPTVTAWTIVQQTRGFELCLKPAQDQESIYGPTFNDYVAKNKNGFVLERKFKLPVYTLVPLKRGQEAPLSDHSLSFPPLVLIAGGPALPFVSGVGIAAHVMSCSTKEICGSSMETGAATVVVGQREGSP
jgi:hypothetical protein